MRALALLSLCATALSQQQQQQQQPQQQQQEAVGGDATAAVSSASLSPSASDGLVLSAGAVGASVIRKGVDGHITLNGASYGVACDCGGAWRQHVAERVDSTAPLCAQPSRFRIRRVDNAPRGNATADADDADGGDGGARDEGDAGDEAADAEATNATLADGAPMTARRVREFIGLPSQLRWVDLPLTPLSAVDERSADGVLAAPGGDMAEFILAMHVYAQARGVDEVSQEDARRYFERFLNATTPRKFYLRTNTASLEHLQRELEVEGLNLAEPPPAVVSELLGDCPSNRAPPCGILKPQGAGDTHVKLMMQEPSRYLVSVSTAQAALRAFFSVLWDQSSPLRDQIKFGITPSVPVHPESAVLHMSVGEGCRTASRLPLVAPKSGKTAAFVIHTDAAALRRLELAKFFAKLDPGHHVDARLLMQRIQRLAQRGMLNTMAKLAKGLPIYEVQVL